MRSSQAAAKRTLADSYEQDVLARVLPLFTPVDDAIVGPGDDAAVMRVHDNRTIMSTDMMVEGPDFSLAWSDPEDLGWKCAAANLADIAAMGGRPTALLVTIAAPAHTEVTFLERVARGLQDCCDILANGCGVVGGDLSISPTLTLSITAFGELEPGVDPVLRSGAKDGHVLTFAGPLGTSARGLWLLRHRAVDSSGRPDAEASRRLRDSYPGPINSHLRPTPPIHLGPRAAQGGATAMIDTSDGVAHDAKRLALASGVDIDFDTGALGSESEAILASAEDHALLATFPPHTALPFPFRQIGTVRGGSGNLFLDGQPFSPRGWDVYQSWKPDKS